MPRKTKAEELRAWLKSSVIVNVLICFKDKSFNREFGIVTDSSFTAIEIAKKKFPSAIEVKIIKVLELIL
jgi:hypothetical protein